MEMKISDMLDRWTILKMKSRYDNNAKEELKLFDGEVSNLYFSERVSLDLFSIVVDLMEANAKTWENESGIRAEYNNDPSAQLPSGPDQLQEIGRHTVLIRQYNKLRLEAKAKIDNLFGQIPDVKVNHPSQ